MFRIAAFRLLDRLDLEPSNQPATPSRRIRPDVWRRLRSLIQDVNAEGAVWLSVSQLADFARAYVSDNSIRLLS